MPTRQDYAICLSSQLVHELEWLCWKLWYRNMATPRHVKLFGMSAKRPLGSSATRASGLKVLPSYFEQEGKQRQDKHCRAHIVGCFLAVIFSKWAARAYLKISKQKQIAADPHLGHVCGRAIAFASR
jgi:hypothetical protein